MDSTIITAVAAATGSLLDPRCEPKEGTRQSRATRECPFWICGWMGRGEPCACRIFRGITVLQAAPAAQPGSSALFACQD
jgi:hypothetical protein